MFITAASIITDILRPLDTGTTILGIFTPKISSVESFSSTPTRVYSRDGTQRSNWIIKSTVSLSKIELIPNILETSITPIPRISNKLVNTSGALPTIFWPK